MSILNLRKYENSFLILASLLIAIINTLPYFASIFRENTGNYPFLQNRYIIERSIYYCLHSLICILIFAYFNYKWKNLLLPKKANKAVRIILTIVYNIILVLIVLIATVYFAEYTVGNPFGRRPAYYYNTLRFVGIYPPSVLLAYVLSFITKTKIMEIENMKLKEENLSSQLKSLKDQVNPHFFFNTMNTLSKVIRLDNKNDALQFVDDLSKVYRYILESDKNNLMKVKSELEFLDSYIYTLRKRFGDKLQINTNIPDRILESHIPPRALQVLVENAIKHNRISNTSPLKINILSDNNSLIVKNNLQQRKDNQDSFGLGLPNLNKRYELLTGKQIIINQTNDEFIVKLPIIRKP